MLPVLALLSDAATRTVAATKLDGGGDCDCQLLELRETLAELDPTLILGLLVPQDQVLVEGLGTSGGDTAALVDLALVKFGGMASSPLPTFEPGIHAATYLSVSLVMDALVLLLSHSG